MEHVGHVDFRAETFSIFLLGLFKTQNQKKKIFYVVCVFRTNPLVDEFEWGPDRIVGTGLFIFFLTPSSD